MRTHRIKLTCTSPECARFLVEEVLRVDFFDFAYRRSGQDGENEDTPDFFISYSGVAHPEVAYVEFDCNEIYGREVSGEFLISKFDDMRAIRTGGNADHKVESIEVEKLPCYKELCKAREELDAIKKSVSNLVLEKD